MSEVNRAVKLIQSQSTNFAPKIGLILGSGLNLLAEQVKPILRLSYGDIPGFPEAHVKGHRGELLLGYLNDVPIACLQGRAHLYEGYKNEAIQIPIRTLKVLGCETLILTNAAASLQEKVMPGNLVLIHDHINFQFTNPLVGTNDDSFGPRFPSLQNAYDSHLRNITKKTAEELGIELFEGVYFATLGPTYETPAEIRAFRLLGADVVGMSTVPEVIVARHTNLKVICISSITNMGSGMSDEELTHENVLKVAHIAAGNLSKLIFNLVTKIV